MVQLGWLAAPAGMLLGGSIVAFSLICEATLQELVPSEALGRVASIDLLGSVALLPIGYSLVGVLVTEVGPGAALLIAGAGTVALALVGLSLRSVRELR